MGAQNGGESHLTRATLNLIIRESLPASVRAQKDTIELICYLANAFVELLSDISNNVCYAQKKKVIIPEHTLRALQELHLDGYLPFVLLDNQSVDNPDPEIPLLDPSRATTDQREDVIQLLLKRMEESKVFSEPRQKRSARPDLTPQDIARQQRLLRNPSNDSEYDDQQANNQEYNGGADAQYYPDNYGQQEAHDAQAQ